jgi:capsular polysaccharide biosynthesis protein
LPFREQVHLFNRHKTILGIIGSGMHNIVLSLEPKRMVYLTPDVYKPNAFLVDRCFEADSTYIQACRAADNVSFLGVRVRRLLTGKLGRNEDGFRTNHNLDHEQIARHLAALGVVA